MGSFCWISFLLPLAKLLVYWVLVIYTWMLLILSSVKMKRCQLRRTKKMKTDLCGYCRHKMILSSYMHSRAWTGYLTKIGREPVTITSKVHSLGIKGTFIVGLLCATSVAGVNNKYSNARQIFPINIIAYGRPPRHFIVIISARNFHRWNN